MTGDRPFGWPAGIATGVGSLPGTDPAEALRLVLGEVAGLPYLPELPARGLGADLLGRGCALLVDLPIEWQPHGWTLTSSPGRDLARARDHLERDLDLLTELAAGVGVLKVQLPGPLTMAAGLELPNLHKVLTDHGAFRDLAGSLAEGARLHLAELRSRLPGTRLVLQVDEPGLPAVLAGRVPTPSGYGTVRALDRSLAEPALAELLAAAPAGCRVVHCCAGEVPYELIRAAGADAVSIDAALLSDARLDAVGEFVDAGGALWLGVVPGTDAEISLSGARESVRRRWAQLGFAPALLPDRVVLTPACGLAGASAGYARRTMSVLRDTATALREDAA
ncbi:MAG TPA: methionine synthase [Jatrophihabitans sp.]|nr:methionine synthase [Jatrophihabitans sp.]